MMLATFYALKQSGCSVNDVYTADYSTRRILNEIRCVLCRKAAESDFPPEAQAGHKYE